MTVYAMEVHLVTLGDNLKTAKATKQVAKRAQSERSLGAEIIQYATLLEATNKE